MSTLLASTATATPLAAPRRRDPRIDKQLPRAGNDGPRWHSHRLAAAMPALLPLAFAAVMVWDILFVGSCEVAGTRIAPETIALGALLGCALLRMALHRRSRDELVQRGAPLLRTFATFWGCIVLVWLLHGADAESAGQFLRVPVYALYVASPILLCTRRRDVLVALRAVLLAGVILCGTTILQGLPTPDLQGGDFRWGFINPTAHAIGLGVCIGYGLLAAQRRPSWLLRALLVLMACVPVYARSRGAMLATAAGCCVVWWHYSRPAARAFWACSHGALALGGIALIASGLLEDLLIASGLLDQYGSSNFFRWQVVLLAGRMLLANPIAGGGLGSMSSPSAGMLDGLSSLPWSDLITRDNDYALFAAEAGCLGLGAIASLAVRFWQRRCAAMRAAETVPLLPVLGAAIFAFVFVLAAFEGIFFDPTGWCLLGLTWACFVVQ